MSEDEIDFLKLKIVAIVYDDGEYRDLHGLQKLGDNMNQDIKGQYAGMIILR